MNSCSITDIHKNSCIDYPDKLSTVIFLSGCTFRCPYCYNPTLVKYTKVGYPKKELFNYLKSRKKFLDGVVITGGEPTLNVDLINLCDEIKQIGYPIKLNTNGFSPRIVEDLINNNLIDYIAMDIKTTPDKYRLYEFFDSYEGTILKMIKTIMESKIDYEFRTTCLKPIITKDDIEIICNHIKGAKKYIIQNVDKNCVVLNSVYMNNNTTVYTDDEIIELQNIVKTLI
jgi:pyruvate formate lyase activating enzyme